MKTVTFITILFCSNILFGQTWDQKFERAAYESRTSNDLLFITSITVTNSFDANQYDKISELFLDTDGIFNMQQGSNDNIILVNHKESITSESLQSLLSESFESLTFEISSPEPFEFRKK